MRRGLALAALALAACLGIASAALPAPTQVARTSSFVCPPSAMANTSCKCTSGCSINSEFSYLWSNPVYPPNSRWLDTDVPTEPPPARAAACAEAPTRADTICGAITLPCTAKAADLAAYLGINGYVRGTSVTGFHFFVGCAPGALVTIYTGFTAGECELLRIRYGSLQRSDPDTPYPVPLLCTTNDCNFASSSKAVGGGASRQLRPRWRPRSQGRCYSRRAATGCAERTSAHLFCSRTCPDPKRMHTWAAADRRQRVSRQRISLVPSI